MKEQESAFPEPYVNDPNLRLGHTKGMTLRDYFAAKAMQGLIERHGLELCADIEKGIGSRVSKCSYILADEMLKEREL